MPYEKVGKNEPVCIANEVPFNIPDSWEWARLGAILHKLSDGTHSTPKYVDSGVPFISVKDVSSGFLDFSNCKYISIDEHADLYARCNPQYGDILLTKVGTTGIPVIVDTNKEFSLFVSVALLKFNQQLLYNEFLIYLINSPLVQKQATENTKGVGNKNWVMRDIANTLIVIPPLKEQYRIVSELKKYDDLLCDYSKKENELSNLNDGFQELLKKSILQEAVQGKLVTQDENDEPASVLLERIRAEKQALVKAGKIKKDKNESVIFRRDNSHYEKCGSEEVCIDDEIPFDIPASWEWIRLGSLVQVNPRNSLDDDKVAGFIPMPLLKEGFNNQHSYEERTWKEIKSGFTHFADGDVVIAKITPCFQNRKSAIVIGLPNGVGAGTTELHVLRDNTKLIHMPYLLLIAKTHDFIENGIKNFTGTAGQQRIGKDFISNYLIPVPPVREQERIVDTVLTLIEKATLLAD